MADPRKEAFATTSKTIIKNLELEWRATSVKRPPTRAN